MFAEEYVFVASESILKRHVAAMQQWPSVGYNVRKLQFALRISKQRLLKMARMFPEEVLP